MSKPTKLSVPLRWRVGADLSGKDAAMTSHSATTANRVKSNTYSTDHHDNKYIQVDCMAHPAKGLTNTVPCAHPFISRDTFS